MHQVACACTAHLACLMLHPKGTWHPAASCPWHHGMAKFRLQVTFGDLQVGGKSYGQPDEESSDEARRMSKGKWDDF